MGKLYGVVQSVSTDKIKVLLSDTSMETCSACALYGTCMSTRDGETSTSGKKGTKSLPHREVLIYDFPAGITQGDNVTISEAPGIELKGAFWAFVLPLILLVATALLLNSHGVSEGKAIAVLFGVITLYGIVLWAMRERLKGILYYRVLSVDHPCTQSTEHTRNAIAEGDKSEMGSPSL